MQSSAQSKASASWSTVSRRALARLLVVALAVAVLGPISPAAVAAVERAEALADRVAELEEAMAEVAEAPGSVDIADVDALMAETIATLDAALVEMPDEPMLLDMRSQVMTMAAELEALSAVITGADEALVAGGRTRGATASPSAAVLTATPTALLTRALKPAADPRRPVEFVEPAEVIGDRSFDLAPDARTGDSLVVNDTAVGDVDGNGTPDIVSVMEAHAGGATEPTDDDKDAAWVVVTRSDGDGGFEPGTAYELPKPHVWMDVTAGLDLGDVDGDEDLDIVTALRGQRTLLTLLNDGTGAFPSAVVTPIEPNGDRTVVLAQFDGDGVLDVAVGSHTDADVAVLLGNGDGTFRAEQVLQPPVLDNVHVLQLDNGSPALVTTGRGSPGAQVWRRGVDAVWTSSDLPQADYVTGAWSLDLDGDGDADLAVAQSHGGATRLLIYRNDDGTLVRDGANDFHVPSLITRYGLPITRGETADADGDGDPDIVASGQFGEVVVAAGDGEGGFEGHRTFTGNAAAQPAGGWVGSMEGRGQYLSGAGALVAEVTGDDIPDIVATSRPTEDWFHGGFGYGSVAVLPGLGGGSFDVAEGTYVGPGWRSDASRDTSRMVDWDGDGRDDLVLATSPWGKGRLWVRKGVPGGFAAPAEAGEPDALCVHHGVYRQTIEVVDVDVDGALDVVCGDYELIVHFGDGAGGIEPVTNLGRTSRNPDGSTYIYSDLGALQVTDVDGDDDLDILFATRTSAQAVQVGWSEQTAAGLSDAVDLATFNHEDLGFSSQFAFDAEIGDFDGNGLADVAVMTYGGGRQTLGDLLVFSNEAGDFTPALQKTGSTGQPPYLTALDADADGDTDLVASQNLPAGRGPSRFANELLRGDGSGTFVAEPLTAGSLAPDPLVADVDGDGLPDLVGPSVYRGVEVRRGNADGTFQDPISLAVPGRGTTQVHPSDVDGDGDLDLVVALDATDDANGKAAQMAVLENISTGGGGGDPDDPDPTDGVDLVLDPVAVLVDGAPATSLTPFGEAEVAIRVRNAGTVDAGPFSDSVWLSADDTWDIGDLRLGTVERTALAAAADAPTTLPVRLPAIVDGTHHVIVRTDARNQVDESDEDNTAVVAVELDLAELTDTLRVSPSAGVPVAVRIPPVGSDARLTAAGDLTGLSVRRDEVPRPTRRDTARDDAGSLLVAQHADDTFVLVEGDGPVDLSLTPLTFGPTDVSPPVVANSGESTLSVTGSGLTADMGVSIVGPDGVRRVATRVTEATGGGLWATVDLAGVVTGRHDLVLESAGEAVSLDDALLVVEGVAHTGGELGDPRQLHLALHVPPRARPGASLEAGILFSNRGLTDLVAPFVDVRTSGMSSPPGAPFEVEGGFSVVPDVEGAPPGVLPPGATGRIRIPFLPASTYEMSADVWSAQSAMPIEQSAGLADVVGTDLPEAARAALFDGLADRVGTTVGSFVLALHELRREYHARGVTVDSWASLRRGLLDQVLLELPGATASGTVTHPNGHAAPFAVVDAGALGTTTADSRGRFALHRDVAVGTPVDLAIVGFGPGGGTTISAGDTGITLVRPAWPPLSGVVTRAGGEPAGRVGVTVRDEESGREVGTTTASDGSYRIAGVQPGTWQVVVRTPTGLEAVTSLTVPNDATEIVKDLQAPEGATLTARVVDPEGVPITGAVVTVAAAGRRTATSDEQGDVTIADLAPGKARVSVAAEGWAPTTRDVTGLTVGATTDLGSVELVAGITLSGVVTDAADGAPVAGAEVLVDRAGVEAAVTAADGTYTVSRLEPGDVTLSAHAEGFLPSQTNVTVGSDAAAVPALRLERARSLGVAVVDGDGEPLAGVAVTVLQDRVGAGTPPSAATDEQGRVLFSELGPEQAVVTAGGTSTTVDLQAGLTDVGLTVEPTTIRASLGSPEGDAVADATVFLVDATGAVVADTVTDASGALQLKVYTTDGLRLMASRSDLGSIAVELPEPVDHVIDLGTVDGSGGSPLTLTLPGDLKPDDAILVEVRPLGTDLDSLRIVEPYVGVDEVEVGPLAPGRYRVSVQFTDRASSVAEVDVSGPTTVAVDVPDGGRIEGTVTQDGGPLAGAVVAAMDDHGRHLETTSSTDGTWHLDHVAVGPWTVVVSDAQDRFLSLDEVEVTTDTPVVIGGSDASIAAVGTSADTAGVAITAFTGASCSTPAEHDQVPIRGRVPHHLVEGLSAGAGVEVYWRMSQLPRLYGPVVTRDDGTFQTPPVWASVKWELIIKAEAFRPKTHGPIDPATAIETPLSQMPCIVEAGDLEHGEPQYDPTPPPRRPSTAHIVDLWLSGVDDERPQISPLIQRVLNLKDPEPEAPKGPKGGGPCPPPPTPEEDDDGDKPDYRNAKYWARLAKEAHHLWGVNIDEINKQRWIAAAEIAVRAAVVVTEIVKVAVPVLKAAGKGKQALAMFSKVGHSRLGGFPKHADVQKWLGELETLYGLSKKVFDTGMKVFVDLPAALQEKKPLDSEAIFGAFVDLMKEFKDLAAGALEFLGPDNFGPNLRLTQALTVWVSVFEDAYSAYENIRDSFKAFNDATDLILQLEEQLEGLSKGYDFAFKQMLKALAEEQDAESDADEGKNAGPGGPPSPPQCPSPPPPPPPPPSPLGPFGGSIQRSSDPNEIYGPAGSGTERWLRPGSPLFYEISFENLGPGSEVVPPGQEPATAPAALVDVVLPLHDAVDLDGVSLGDFGFDDTRFAVPPGATTFAEDVPLQVTVPDGDATTTIDLVVQARAAVDRAARQVRWTIEAVDPATGLVHSDPLAGFLPPEPVDDEGAGQGFAEVVLSALPDVPTGTTVTEQATIVFDQNTPIATNVWSNRFDRTAPQAGMAALETTTAIGSAVSWAGSDDGSGVRRYDVLRSEAGGPLLPWISNTTATSAPLVGVPGVRYGFAVIATDGAGNLTDTATVAQTTTTAVPPGPGAPGPGPGPGPDTNTDVPNVPGPSEPPRRPGPPTCKGVEGRRFSDVGVGFTHFDAITCAAGLGLVEGMGDGTFRPRNRLTRGQFATILAGALDASGVRLDNRATAFRDVRGTTHQRAIELLAGAAIVNGKTSTRFDPNRTVTRGQVMTMLDTTSTRLLAAYPAVRGPRFTDTARSVHAGAIDRLNAGGIAHGLAPDGRRFGPNRPVLRGQVAAFVTRWLTDQAGRLE